MAAFDNPLPPTPNTSGQYDDGAQYNAHAQRQVQNHSGELESRVLALQALLAPYIPTFIRDADGQALEVLARVRDTTTADRAGFAVVTKQESGTWKWGLWPGNLYDTFDNANAILTISALLATDLSSGFIDIGSYPAQIGLEIAVDWSGVTPSVTSVTVVDGDPLNVRVQYVSDLADTPTYSQTYARIVLASATDSGDGSPLLTSKPGDLQLFFTSATGHLSDGSGPQAVPALYPF